jgi:hypothetical protein
VAGPPGPVCGTNRDLYTRLVGVGQDMTAAGRTLEEFLRAWWLVGRPMAARARLEPDTVAAMVAAAATIDPPPLRQTWRTTPYRLAHEPTEHADWERVVLSQIADLADLADAGPRATHALGMEVPRPPGSIRATGGRWHTFDPRAYLERGMAGSLGGREEAGGSRSAVPGPVDPVTAEPESGEQVLNTLSWGDLATLSVCGQEDG